MSKISWKKWIIGCVLAVLSGLLAAGAGLLGDMSWKSFIGVLCASIATNLGNYLAKHPVENVEDTAYVEKRVESILAAGKTISDEAKASEGTK